MRFLPPIAMYSVNFEVFGTKTLLYSIRVLKDTGSGGAESCARLKENLCIHQQIASLL